MGFWKIEFESLKIVNCAEDDLIVVVWGKPIDPDRCTTSNDLPIDQCVKNCYNDSHCMLFYQSGNDCVICGWQRISQVGKSDAKSGTKVGFKIRQKLVNNQCLPDNNPPTFNDQPASGFVNVFDPYPSVGYQIRFDSSTSTWVYSFQTCQTGWMYFDRVKGRWCLKVFQTGGMNVADSKALCVKNGAVISSLDTVYERDWAASSVCELNNGEGAYVYVDGEKSEKCSVDNWQSIPECNTIDGFTFTDPLVFEKRGYYLKTPSSCTSPSCGCHLSLPGVANPDDRRVDENCGSNILQFVLCGNSGYYP